MKRINEVRKEIEKLKNALNVEITISGRKAVIGGDPLDEYEAMIVLEAIELGFSVKKALTLKDEVNIFRKIFVKNLTKRKDLWSVRARIVGKEGRTKRAIEDISGCSVVLSENTVGIIGPAEKIEEATTALSNLIRGSKHANVYRYLERTNASRKKNRRIE